MDSLFPVNLLAVLPTFQGLPFFRKEFCAELAHLRVEDDKGIAAVQSIARSDVNSKCLFLLVFQFFFRVEDK